MLFPHHYNLAIQSFQAFTEVNLMIKPESAYHLGIVDISMSFSSVPARSDKTASLSSSAILGSSASGNTGSRAGRRASNRNVGGLLASLIDMLSSSNVQQNQNSYVNQINEVWPW